jgi:hypothetical protein
MSNGKSVTERMLCSKEKLKMLGRMNHSLVHIIQLTVI